MPPSRTDWRTFNIREDGAESTCQITVWLTLGLRENVASQSQDPKPQSSGLLGRLCYRVVVSGLAVRRFAATLQEFFLDLQVTTLRAHVQMACVVFPAELGCPHSELFLLFTAILYARILRRSQGYSAIRSSAPPCLWLNELPDQEVMNHLVVLLMI